MAGSSVASMPSARREPSRHRRQRLSACERLRPHEMEAEIPVAEHEPALAAEPLRLLERRPGLARAAPTALLVGEAGERVEDAVEVGRDMDAEHLDVVADVPDHRHARRDRSPGRARAGIARRPHRPRAPRSASCPDPTGENVPGTMDTSRFAAELPGLFDDYPRSEHPRGRRFGDLVDGMPNLATENTLAVVNLAASLLGPARATSRRGRTWARA